jgi:ATPase expression protein 3
MSLLNTLKEYMMLCKEHNMVLRRSSRVPCKQYAAASLAPTTEIAAKAPIDEITRIDLWNQVGLGSAFHKNYVKETLKPLAYPPLRRGQEPRQKDYPTNEAKKRYLLEKSLENTRFQSTIMHELNRKTISQIIETLVEITPKADSLSEMSPIQQSDPRLSYRAPKHIYTEVPTLPDFREHPEKFDEYIYQLTHSTFHYKQSSKFNGIIPKILRNLFHPLNLNTLPIRSAQSFNHVIFYFVNKWDIATCRELLVQMKSEGKIPTTTTYNIMLKALTTLQKIQHISDPYNVALKHLTQMKRYSLNADLVTWNIMFALLKDDLSKEIILLKRAELKIPIDDRFMYTLVKYMSNKNGMTAKKMLIFMKELGIPLEGRVVNVVSGMLIQERQFTSALKIIEYAHDKGSSYHANREVLNMFMNVFAQLKRVDLCVGMMNTFQNKFHVKPDYDTYDILFEAMARSGFWNEKYEILRVLYHRMLDDIGVISGDYWLKRLRSRLKFIHDIPVKLSPNLTVKELKLKHMMDDYHFDDKIPRWINSAVNPEMRKAAIKMGYYASREAVTKRESPVLDEKKQKVKDYRDGLSKMSIKRSMEKRLPYAKDPYAALKDELHERQIIS